MLPKYETESLELNTVLVKFAWVKFKYSPNTVIVEPEAVKPWTVKIEPAALFFPKKEGEYINSKSGVLVTLTTLGPLLVIWNFSSAWEVAKPILWAAPTFSLKAIVTLELVESISVINASSKKTTELLWVILLIDPPIWLKLAVSIVIVSKVQLIPNNIELGFKSTSTKLHGAPFAIT